MASDHFLGVPGGGLAVRSQISAWIRGLMLVLAAIATPMVVVAAAFGLLAMFRIAATTSMDQPSAVGSAAEERVAHHLPRPQTMMPPDQIIVPPVVDGPVTPRSPTDLATNISDALDLPDAVAAAAPTAAGTPAPPSETAAPDPTPPTALNATTRESASADTTTDAAASLPTAALPPVATVPPPALPAAATPDSTTAPPAGSLVGAAPADRPTATLESSKPGSPADPGPAATVTIDEMGAVATAEMITPQGTGGEATIAIAPPKVKPAAPPKAHQTAAKHRVRPAPKRPRHRVPTASHGYGASDQFRSTPMQSTWTSFAPKYR